MPTRIRTYGAVGRYELNTVKLGRGVFLRPVPADSSSASSPPSSSSSEEEEEEKEEEADDDDDREMQEVEKD